MTPLQHLNLFLRHDLALNLRAAIGDAVISVFDAGCGAGLLSFWAKAGTSEVVAADLEAIDLAGALAKENGFQDVIRFMQADLWTVDLPEHLNNFDVIVAMIYLNDPRRDDPQSQLAYSLRDPYLKPDGVMIPDKVRYHVWACDWPAQDHPTRLRRLQTHIRDLEGRYGLGFSALAEGVKSAPWHAFFPPKGSHGCLHMEGARVLSEATPFAEIDYRADSGAYPDRFTLAVTRLGMFSALVWTQELWFQDRLLFADESVSWIDAPQALDAGAARTVHLGDRWRCLNFATIEHSGEGLS